MRYYKHRNNPRVYKKNNTVQDETVLSLSLAAAAGVLAFTFVKGMFWGYLIGKRLR